MTTPLSWTIVRMQFTAAARLWWIRLFTAAYGLMTVAMAYSAGVIGGAQPDEAFARLTVATLPLLLMLVPLESLLAGTLSESGDNETAFLLAQPVTRSQYLLSRWFGLALAITSSVTVGFILGGGFVAVVSGARDVHRLPILVSAGVLTGVTFLSIAFLTASLVSRRLAAIGVASFIWFVSVIFYDAVMLGIAVWMQGASGARVLFLSVFGNIIDLVRVLTLIVAGTPHILGAAGESWLRALGGPGPATLLSIVGLMAWMVLPLAAAVRIDASRDL